MPQLKRIVFDNGLEQKEAVELVKSGERHVDLVTELSPLETLRVARSASAKVVKKRGTMVTIFGFFNMRKQTSPWRDIRLRQAANFAINRPDLIRYAAKGNGVIIPALVTENGFGYDPSLEPYPFDPAQARQLMRQAGYPDGIAVTLIASEDLAVQATVVSKMLEQAGFQVDLQMLSMAEYNRKTLLSHLEQPPEAQTWDIALLAWQDLLNFPAFETYHIFALGGMYDWMIESPKLSQLYEQVMSTVDRERQQALIRLMERHTHDQAYFLFLYNPIQLYAANKAVTFVPYANALKFAETSVTDQHWSVNKAKAALQK